MHISSTHLCIAGVLLYTTRSFLPSSGPRCHSMIFVLVDDSNIQRPKIHLATPADHREIKKPTPNPGTYRIQLCTSRKKLIQLVQKISMLIDGNDLTLIRTGIPCQIMFATQHAMCNRCVAIHHQVLSPHPGLLLYSTLVQAFLYYSQSNLGS
jgi:hypothetical protein